MSISTKTGDFGTTSLLFNRRVRKTHPRIHACGDVDEFTAALGVAKAHLPTDQFVPVLELIQNNLIKLMGELAVDERDSERYRQSKLPKLDQASLDQLDSHLAELESDQPDFSGWAIPGKTKESAFLDMARTLCRRAERSIIGICSDANEQHALALQFLNRSSDVLWLVARAVEEEVTSKV